MIQFKKYEEAVSHLECALELEPNNNVVKEEMQKLARMMSTIKNHEPCVSFYEIPVSLPDESPANNFEFQSLWSELGCKSDTRVNLRKNLLQKMVRDSRLDILTTSLDPSLMSEILEVLPSDEQGFLAMNVVHALEASAQFSLSQLLLDSHERKGMSK